MNRVWENSVLSSGKLKAYIFTGDRRTEFLRMVHQFEVLQKRLKEKHHTEKPLLRAWNVIFSDDAEVVIHM